VNRTFIIVKPDGVRRGLVGEVLNRFEQRGIVIVAAQLRTIETNTAKMHYAEHAEKPFFAGLVEFITSGPSLLAVLEGPQDTWKIVRTMIGATNPAESAPGTIRGDLAVEMGENIIHGSDSAESAQREIALFFPNQQ
jgi:nucleoside-diphosphate kinase